MQMKASLFCPFLVVSKLSVGEDILSSVGLVAIVFGGCSGLKHRWGVERASLHRMVVCECQEEPPCHSRLSCLKSIPSNTRAEGFPDLPRALTPGPLSRQDRALPRCWKPSSVEGLRVP